MACEDVQSSRASTVLSRPLAGLFDARVARSEVTRAGPVVIDSANFHLFSV